MSERLSPFPQEEGFGEGAVPRIFLHFHVEIAHFVGILAVNFKFYSMNKTVTRATLSQGPPRDAQ